jgi:DNA-binding transcriptional ArsR family regulator
MPMPDVTSDLFKALSDPTRRALFERLAREGELTVHQLTERSGVSQPMVSKHLFVLKKADLVTDRRSGRETRYTATPRTLERIVDWMAEYGDFWSDRLDRLEDLLGRMDQ